MSSVGDTKTDSEDEPLPGTVEQRPAVELHRVHQQTRTADLTPHRFTSASQTTPVLLSVNTPGNWRGLRPLPCPQILLKSIILKLVTTPM